MITRKYLLFIAGLALCSLAADAKEITPSQARAIAAKYVNTGRAKAMRQFKAQPTTTASKDGEAPSFYAINDAGGKGFVLIAGDDCIDPVLGYSPTGSIDYDRMPPQLKAWLEAVSTDITSMRKAGGGVAATAGEGEEGGEDTPTAVVAPLLKTHWDQGTPYNNLTPSIEGKQTMTGCVATAVSQMLMFYRWPEQGTGSVKYDTPNYDQKTIDLDLSKSAYNWDAMLNDYTSADGAPNWTEAQGTAVATLMRDVGAAIHMGYGVKASGAWGRDVANVVNRHFGYKAVTYEKENYNTRDWVELIKGFLDEGDPLAYAGQDLNSGGHEFVIDGYDSRNFLHVNWGWSGSGDGYYTFAKFGYATTNFNYTMALTHFVPNKTGDTDVQEEQTFNIYVPRLADDNGDEIGKVEGTKSDFKAHLKFTVQHPSMKTFDGKVRFAVKDSKNNNLLTFGEQPIKTTSSTDQETAEADLTGDMLDGIADGTYQLTIEAQDTRSDGTPFDNWLKGQRLSYDMTLAIAGGNVTVRRCLSRVAPITCKSLTFDKQPVTLGDKLTWSVSLDTQTDDDNLWNTLMLVLTDADNADADPIIADRIVFSAFAGQTNEFSQSKLLAAADGFKEGNYNAMLFVKNSEGMTPVKMECGNIKLTIAHNDNPTRPYVTNSSMEVTYDDEQTDTFEPDGNVVDIDMSKGLYDLKFSYDVKWRLTDILPEDKKMFYLVHLCNGKAADTYGFAIDDFNDFSVPIEVNIYEDLFSEENYGNVIEWMLLYKAPDSEKLVYVDKENGDKNVFKIRLVDPTSGISDITGGDTNVTSRFDIVGRRIAAPAKGLNIVRTSDGKVKKVLVR